MLNSHKIKRNELCPCGSGKKLKRCCLAKVRRVQAGVEAGKSRDEILCEEMYIDAAARRNHE